MGTSCVPRDLIGSTDILRRSSFTPVCASTASAMSTEVTEPNSRPPSPARALISTRLAASWRAVASAPSFSRRSRTWRERRIDSAWDSIPRVATMARPFGTR